MYSRRKSRHLKGVTDASSASMSIPDVTADAEVRLERLSADSATGTWYDITSFANNGTASTASTLADFYFNESGKSGNEVVDLANTNSTGDPTKSFSITCWASNLSAAGDNVILFSTRNPTAGTTGWKVQDFPATLPNPDYEWVSTNASATGFGPLAPQGIGSGWAFLAFTWQPGTPNVLKGYSNGVLFGSVGPGTFLASTDPLRLFRGIYSGNSWTGHLDTCRIYPRILSPDEILRDYNAGLAAHQAMVTKENLVSQYVPMGQTTTAWTDVTDSNSMTGAVTSPSTFDGDDYYTIGNPANLKFAGAFSVEVWVSQVNDSSQGSERVISKDAVDGNRSFIMTMRDNTGKAEAYLFQNNVTLTALVSTATYTNNDWHHMVAVNYGAGQPFQLWVDGALQAEDATGGYVMQDTVADWEVGRSQKVAEPDYLNGRCDTVRFYSAALSSAEIQENYQAGLAAHQ